MTGEEAVGFYHSLQRFGINPGLERIKALCRLLGDPQNSFRCVHVAGTNGKGSTCTEIASVLTFAGYKTGLYTSPYVLDFRERIRFCGEMISEENLACVTEKISAAVAALAAEKIFVTEFEAVTAAAFLYYKEQGCEIAVLETGLGGRYDATNIITDPLCCVITSVSLDHIKILGDTVEQIAFEKCGIIKNETSVVTSENQQASVLNVIRQTAAERRCELVVASNTQLSVKKADITGTDVKYGDLSLHIPFCGVHQIENASLALNAISILREKGYLIPDDALADGFKKASVPARTEILSDSPLVILDGSHNEGSTSALARVIAEYLSDRKILAVIGMMADKDCAANLDNLLPFFAKVIAVKPSNPRSLDPTDLCRMVSDRQIECEAVEDPREGAASALAQIENYDALIVCGSLYLAADIRPTLLELLKK